MELNYPRYGDWNKWVSFKEHGFELRINLVGTFLAGEKKLNELLKGHIKVYETKKWGHFQFLALKLDADCGNLHN